MLILTRVPQQAIYISHPDGDITIRILDVSGASVRIGVEAAKTITILRDDAKVQTSSGCIKCGAGDFGDASALCWKCFRTEQED